MTFSWTSLYGHLHNYYDSYWTSSLQITDWILPLLVSLGVLPLNSMQAGLDPLKEPYYWITQRSGENLHWYIDNSLFLFFNLESLNSVNQPLCVSWWFCSSECNYLWLNRRCFLPQLTYNKNSKQLSSKRTNSNLHAAKASFHVPGISGWRKHGRWGTERREVWGRGNSDWELGVWEELTQSVSFPGLVAQVETKRI